MSKEKDKYFFDEEKFLASLEEKGIKEEFFKKIKAGKSATNIYKYLKEKEVEPLPSITTIWRWEKSGYGINEDLNEKMSQIEEELKESIKQDKLAEVFLKSIITRGMRKIEEVGIDEALKAADILLKNKGTSSDLSPEEIQNLLDKKYR